MDSPHSGVYAARVIRARPDWWDDWGGAPSVLAFVLLVGTVLVLGVNVGIVAVLGAGLWFWWDEHPRAPVVALAAVIALLVALGIG